MNWMEDELNGSGMNECMLVEDRVDCFEKSLPKKKEICLFFG